MQDIDILEQHAVDAAIAQDWSNAIELNKQILETEKKNVDALLRMGFAYMRSSDIENAKSCYNKVLKQQPRNPVALENLERIQILEEKGGMPGAQRHRANLDPNLFLDTPGKTKTVTLVMLGQKDLLALLTAGQEVELKLKKRRVEIRTQSGDYLGSLPDDLSKRLIFFIKNKSEYKAFVKEANITRVVIFIREEVKGKRVAHYTSFPQNIQNNLENMNADDPPAELEDEEAETSGDEWEKMASDLADHEEKEDIIEIHQEEEENEE